MCSMEKATFTTREMGKYLGIGQVKAYQIVAIADEIGLPILRFGKKNIKIPRNALDEWMKSEVAQKALSEMSN